MKLWDYFEPLQRIAETEELVEREKKVDLLKWNWLENEAFFHYFTVERLFVFLLQLDMVERWTRLDKEKRKGIIRQMIQNLKRMFKFRKNLENSKKNIEWQQKEQF